MRKHLLVPLGFVVYLSLNLHAQAPSGAAAASPTPLWQLFAWTAAVLTAVYGIRTGESQIRANRRQRELELAWRRSDVSRQLNDEVLKDRLALAALLMIDYPSGRPFRIGRTEVHIDHAAVIDALTFREPATGAAVMPERDRYIRDAFDALLYRWGFLEHYVSRRLVEFDDVRHPASYYIRRVAETNMKNIVGAYVETYHFELTKQFLARF